MRSRVVGFGLATCAIAVGSATLHSMWQQADAARSGWGTSTPVVVVERPIGAGEPVSGATIIVERPGAMVPPGALRDLSIGADVRAAVDLHPGEILLESRLVGRGDGALPAGTLALGVEVTTAVTVMPGDVVDLWATDVTTMQTTLVAEAVVVLGQQDEVVTVAVPEASVARVAAAAVRPVTIARR